MADHCAISADYVNWRPVNGRKVLQLVFEVPLESTHDVLTKLGTPTPGESKWVAIALLDLSKPKELVQAEGGSPKKWNDYKPSQQAAILCDDPDFQRYFNAEGPKDAAEKLRQHFKIESRAHLDETFHNAERWMEFVALYRLHQERHGSPLRGASQ